MMKYNQYLKIAFILPVLWLGEVQAVKTKNLARPDFYEPCFEALHADESLDAGRRTSRVEPCEWLPPPRKPSNVKYIFSSYSNDNDVVILDWSAVNKGNGYGFNYQVYQQIKYESPKIIYRGSSTTTKKVVTTKKPVRFLVKACSSAGCSYDKYNEYITYNYDNKHHNKRTKPIESFSNTSSKSKGRQALLGNGYDELRDEYTTDTCFTENSIFNNEVDKNRTDYSFNQVYTYDQLATELELKKNGGLKLNFGKFSFGGSIKKSIYSKTENVKETSAIVISYTYRHKQYNSSVNPKLKSQFASYMKENSDTEKLYFRENCGDKYVSSVTTGKKFLYTITMSKSTGDSEKIIEKTSEFKAGLKNIANANYGSQETLTFKDKWENYSFNIVGAAQGGSNHGDLLIEGTEVGADTVLEKLKEFAHSGNDNLVNIETTEKYYPTPSNLYHYDVFANIRPYQTVLLKWAHFDQQLKDRCSPLDNQATREAYSNYFNDNDEYKRCGKMSSLISRTQDFCLNQNDWQECVVPNECMDEDDNCLELAEIITFKRRHSTNEKTLYLRKEGGLGTKSFSKKIKDCFVSGIIPDYSRGHLDNKTDYNMDKVPAMTISINGGHNIVSARASVKRDIYYNRYCYEASTTIRRRGIFKAGAKFDSQNTMHGIEPIEGIPYDL